MSKSKPLVWLGPFQLDEVHLPKTISLTCEPIYTFRLSVGTFKPEVVHLALELSVSRDELNKTVVNKRDEHSPSRNFRPIVKKFRKNLSRRSFQAHKLNCIQVRDHFDI